MTEEKLAAPKNIQMTESLFLRLINRFLAVLDLCLSQVFSCVSSIIQQKRYSDYCKLFPHFTLSDRILFKNCLTKRAKCT